MELMHLVNLGRIPYAEGLRLMRQAEDARRAGVISDTLLLMEHPAVVTLGRNASRANLLASEEYLNSKGVAVYEVNRGGDITYHGPGQLVGYPIFDLRGDLPQKSGPHLGPVEFVRLIEESLIRVCKDFGILAQRVAKRTGVWTLGGGTVSEKKIAAIGIHVSQAITTHGFALNVTTDLRDFNWIIPCGINNTGVTSLELETASNLKISLTGVADTVARSFGRVFHRQVIAADSLAALLGSRQEIKPHVVKVPISLAND